MRLVSELSSVGSVKKAHGGQLVQHLSEFGSEPDAKRSLSFQSFSSNDATIRLPHDTYDMIHDYTYEDELMHPLLDDIAVVRTVSEGAVTPNQLAHMPSHVVEFCLSDHELVAFAGQSRAIAVWDAYQHAYDAVDGYTAPVDVTMRRDVLARATDAEVAAFIDDGFSQPFESADTPRFEVMSDGESQMYVSVGTAHGHHVCVAERDRYTYFEGGAVSPLLIRTQDMSITGLTEGMTRDALLDFRVNASIRDAYDMLSENDVAYVSTSLPTGVYARSMAYTHEVVNASPSLLARQCAEYAALRETMSAQTEGSERDTSMHREVVVEQVFSKPQTMMDAPNPSERMMAVMVADRTTGERIHGMGSGSDFKPFSMTLGELNHARILNQMMPFSVEHVANAEPVYNEQGVCIQKGKPLLDEPLPLSVANVPNSHTQTLKFDTMRATTRPNPYVAYELKQTRERVSVRESVSKAGEPLIAHVLKPELTGEPPKGKSRVRQRDDGLSL